MNTIITYGMAMMAIIVRETMHPEKYRGVDRVLLGDAMAGLSIDEAAAILEEHEAQNGGVQ